MSTSTLSKIVEAWGGLIQTGPFGSQLHQHDYSEQGIPVVMPKDIRNGRVDESGIARIPEGKANQLSRHFLKAGSVVFPRRGEISKCAYIDEDQAGFLCGTGCIKIEPPADKLRSKFLFSFLGLRQSIERLERNAVGTTMLNLNTKILGGLKVPLLASKRQDEIVEILSAYDDLIENNRRRIQLLEQAAGIVARLTGKQPDPVATEEEFLHRQYQNISIKSLSIDPNLVPVLESRLAEAQHCLSSAPLTTICLCGSILEGILLGVALQKQKEFNQAANSPKGKDNKVKPFHDWSLAQFIDVAHGLGALKLDVKKFSHELRDFRNYIHPYQQLASKFTPDKHTAEICLQVLKAAIADLSGGRK